MLYVPLTEEQIEKIPEYIDNATEVIDVVRRKDGSVRLKLGTKINGYSVMFEWVSKGRHSMHPVTAWAMSTDDYETRYKNRNTTPINTSRASNDARSVDINRSGSTQTVPQTAQEVKPCANAAVRTGNGSRGSVYFRAAMAISRRQTGASSAIMRKKLTS